MHTSDNEWPGSAEQLAICLAWNEEGEAMCEGGRQIIVKMMETRLTLQSRHLFPYGLMPIFPPLVI